LQRLFGHGVRYGTNAMPDVDHRSLPGGVQILFAVRRRDPAAFSANSNGVFFFETAWEESWMIRHGVRILAELRRGCTAEQTEFS